MYPAGGSGKGTGAPGYAPCGMGRYGGGTMAWTPAQMGEILDAAVGDVFFERLAAPAKIQEGYQLGLGVRTWVGRAS